MPVYKVKPSKGIVEEVVEEVAVPEEVEDARSVLSKYLKKAWEHPSLQRVREQLRAVGEEIKDDYERIAEETGYGKALEQYAERVGLDQMMEDAWNLRFTQKRKMR